MVFPSVELIGCRYDEATDDMPGHHAVPRDWREDVFGAMLKAVGCSIYGYPEENSPLVSAEVHYAEDDETRHFVIDTPLLTLRPYYWGDCRAIRRLPNFVYKPWSLEISWYKWPMRDAYANISLSDSDWRLMCETVERAVVEFHKCGVWPADIDGSPRMGEVDEVAWELRKQMGIIADQRNVLEDALSGRSLWSLHTRTRQKLLPKLPRRMQLRFGRSFCRIPSQYHPNIS